MRAATAESFETITKTLSSKVLGFMAVLILVCALSVGFFTDKAYAKVHQADISERSVEIYPDKSLLYIKYIAPGESDVKDELLDTANGVIISGTSDTNFISVRGTGAIGEGDFPVKITLNGVNLAKNDDSFCAFALSNNAWVNLTLAEGSTNTLQSGANRAGLEVSQNSIISIGGTGTLNALSNGNGAGIGGGNDNSGTINILSGTINAQSSGNGAGIGGGNVGGGNGGGGTINISGGTIVAGGSGVSDIGEGNLDSGGITTISGGNVRTSGKGVVPAPINGAGKAVYLNTLTLEGGVANTAITAGNIDGVDCSETADPGSGVYGIRDLVSDKDGKLYLYLPANDTGSAKVSLKTNDTTYKKTYARQTDANTVTLLADAAAPNITSQPKSQTVKINESALALSVLASITDTGSLTYQWYKNNSNSYVGAALIQGATQPSYSPATSAVGTTYYYCEITNTKDEGVDKTVATTQTEVVSVAVTKHILSLTLTCANITAGQTPNPQLSGNAGGGAVAFEYKVQGADDTTYSTSVPQTAGKYTVRAKVAETDTHEAATSPEANFTIKAASKDDPTDDDDDDPKDKDDPTGKNDSNKNDSNKNDSNKNDSNKGSLAKTGDHHLPLIGFLGLLVVVALIIARLSLRKQNGSHRQ